MLVAARLFWVRGTDTNWKVRWAIARQRWTPARRRHHRDRGRGVRCDRRVDLLQQEYPQSHRKSGAPGAAARNTRRPQAALREAAAEDRRREVAADIFPYEHRAQFKGTFTPGNKSAGPIPELSCKSRSWLR